LGAKLRDRRIQIVVIAALSLVVLHNARHFLQRDKTGQHAVEMEVPFSESIAQSETPRWVSGDYTVASQWGRDPFDPADRSNSWSVGSTPPQRESKVLPPSLPRIRITGIGVVGGSRFVLAGDKILREGDRVGAGTIREIRTKSVLIEYDDGTKTINME
jgi:hypothetical protein